MRPASLVSVLDANGKLALKPSSPASAMNGAPQFVDDRALTPDFYAVNTMQPAYQPSGIAPAAGGDPALADPAKSSAARADREDHRRHAVGEGRRLGVVRGRVERGRSPTACSRPRQARRHLRPAVGSPNFQSASSAVQLFQPVRTRHRRARSPSQGLHGSRRRHRRGKAPGRRVLQAAGQSQRAPGLHRRAPRRRAHRRRRREDQVEPDLELDADHHHLRRERRILGSRRAARRRSLGPGERASRRS